MDGHPQIGLDGQDGQGEKPSVSLNDVLDRIRIHVNSGLHNQKAPAKLLLAVEKTLEEKGVKGSELTSGTAHFAVLLTILESSLREREENYADGELTEALSCPVYLLSQIMPYLDKRVVRSRMSTFSDTATTLFSLGNDDPAYIRSLISLFESVISSLDSPSLSRGVMKKEFKTINTLIVDPRPKVRKRAQDAVRRILISPPPPIHRHPWLRITIDFVISSLTEVASIRDKSKKTSGTEARGNWLCAFTKSLVMYWPLDRVQPLCDVLLRLTRLDQPLLTIAVYELFETMFAKSSELFEPGKVNETFKALLESKPHNEDFHVLPAWYRIMKEAINVYARLEPDRAYELAPTLFVTVFDTLQSDNEGIRQGSGACSSAIITHAISDSRINHSNDMTLEDDSTEGLNIFIERLQIGMTTQYISAWPEVLTVLGHLISRLGRDAAGLTADLVRNASRLRGQMSIEQKMYAEKVLAIAVRHYGPERFFELLPLGIEGGAKAKDQRAWLLPLVKGHIFSTNLSHFIDYFAPLSSRLYLHAQEAKNNGMDLETKTIQTLIEQIWALLPDYCNFARDVSTSFNASFGEMLANVLYTQDSLRNPIFHALQLLVQSNQSVLSSSMQEEDLSRMYGLTKHDAQVNIDHLRSMAPNLLAVMFNVFSQMGTQNKGLISDCIMTYLSILSSDDMQKIYAKVHALIEQSLLADSKAVSGQSANAQTMLDLAQTLVQALDTQSLERLLSVVEKLWSHPEGGLQKRAYKIVNAINARPEGRRLFMSRSQDHVASLMAAQEKARTPIAARKERFATLSTIVHDLPDESLYFVPTILTEAIQGTKDGNEKIRNNAFDLVLEMAKRMSRGGTIVQSKLNSEEEMDLSMPSKSPFPRNVHQTDWLRCGGLLFGIHRHAQCRTGGYFAKHDQRNHLQSF